MTVGDLRDFLIEANDSMEVRVQMEDGVCLPAEADCALFWEAGADGVYREVKKLVLSGKWPAREE